jgi:hypothetical protein
MYEDFMEAAKRSPHRPGDRYSEGLTDLVVGGLPVTWSQLQAGSDIYRIALEKGRAEGLSEAESEAMAERDLLAAAKRMIVPEETWAPEGAAPADLFEFDEHRAPAIGDILEIAVNGHRGDPAKANAIYKQEYARELERSGNAELAGKIAEHAVVEAVASGAIDREPTEDEAAIASRFPPF